MLKPLADKVVIKPGPEEERSSGGIVLPDTAKRKPQEGKVVAVGPGKLLEDGRRAAMSVKKGDTVIYSKYGGTEITVKGEDLVILGEDEILAVKE
jgi:chaperonin GroES